MNETYIRPQNAEIFLVSVDDECPMCGDTLPTFRRAINHWKRYHAEGLRK